MTVAIDKHEGGIAVMRFRDGYYVAHEGRVAAYLKADNNRKPERLVLYDTDDRVVEFASKKDLRAAILILRKLLNLWSGGTETKTANLAPNQVTPSLWVGDGGYPGDIKISDGFDNALVLPWELTPLIDRLLEIETGRAAEGNGAKSKGVANV